MSGFETGEGFLFRTRGFPPIRQDHEMQILRLESAWRAFDFPFHAMCSCRRWNPPEQKEEAVAAFAATPAADGILQPEQLREIRQLESRGAQIGRAARTAFHGPSSVQAARGLEGHSRAICRRMCIGGWSNFQDREKAMKTPLMASAAPDRILKQKQAGYVPLPEPRGSQVDRSAPIAFHRPSSS